MTLKGELKVLKAKKLGGVSSPPPLPPSPGTEFCSVGCERAWYPRQGGCSGQAPGLGGDREVEDLLLGTES